MFVVVTSLASPFILKYSVSKCSDRVMFCDFDRAVSARLCSGTCPTPADWTISGELQALVTARCKKISECNISQLNSSNCLIVTQEAGRSTATLTSLMTAVHDGRRFPPEDAPISSTR